MKIRRLRGQPQRYAVYDCIDAGVQRGNVRQNSSVHSFYGADRRRVAHAADGPRHVAFYAAHFVPEAGANARRHIAADLRKHRRGRMNPQKVLYALHNSAEEPRHIFLQGLGPTGNAVPDAAYDIPADFGKRR